MNRIWLIGAGGCCMLFMAASCLVLLRLSGHQKRMAERIKLSQGVAPAVKEKRQGTAKLVWARVVALLGQLILRTGLLSSRTRAELEITLLSAGLRGSKGLEIFVGSKIGLAVASPTLVYMLLNTIGIPNPALLVMVAAAGVTGLLSPDSVVRYRHKHYIRRVERGLPDALDLLVICSQAGLGLTAAISRVADEMQQGNQAVGLEMALTANELQLIETYKALQNLGSRTNIRGLVRLGTTLIQSMQYGTPLTEAMQTLANELRQEMLTRFEARAARLGVLLTLPMIVFILPCVFLVVGGPAAVQVMSVGR